MDTLGVTLDVYFAAIDGHDAAKEGLFAVKGEAIAANDGSVVGMAGHFAAKRGVSEKKRVSFAVMRGDYAAMRELNTAK